jgi:hypothetical protein
MHSMIELHPTPDALDGLGLPAIPYPVALPAFQAAVANDGELPLADMLHGLQLRAAAPGADWQRMEPAMARLAELLASDDPRECITAAGGDWWIEVGPVDLEAGGIVTLQRGQTLLAAIAPREDGRLRVAAYRPLDGRALEIMQALAKMPEPAPDATDRPTCWQRARAASTRGLGHDPGQQDDLTGLSWWSAGLGIGHDGGELPDWRAQAALVPRRPACVVAEIGTFDMLRGAPAG